MHVRYLKGGVIGLILVLGGSGCGGQAKLVKVSGVVTLDGAPLPGAAVVFSSIKGGRDANGMTDDEGRFELTTFKSKDGALPGEYKVVVTVTPALDPSIGGVALDPNDKNAMAKAFMIHSAKMKEQKEGKSTESKSAVHPNYTKVDTTPLREVVPSGGPVKIELKKSGT